MGVGPVGFSVEQQNLLWVVWRRGDSKFCTVLSLNDMGRTHNGSFSTKPRRTGGPAHEHFKLSCGRGSREALQRAVVVAHARVVRLRLAEPDARTVVVPSRSVTVASYMSPPPLIT